MHFMEAILITGILPSITTNILVLISSFNQTSVDTVLISVDKRAEYDRVFNQRRNGSKLYAGQHLED